MTDERALEGLGPGIVDDSAVARATVEGANADEGATAEGATTTAAEALR